MHPHRPLITRKGPRGVPGLQYGEYPTSTAQTPGCADREPGGSCPWTPLSSSLAAPHLAVHLHPWASGTPRGREDSVFCPFR